MSVFLGYTVPVVIVSFVYKVKKPYALSSTTQVIQSMVVTPSTVLPMAITWLKFLKN